MFFPRENAIAQRGTASLILLSNLPVLLMHFIIFERGSTSEMLIINFLATEPKSLSKILYLDILTILLQVLLIQFVWEEFPLKVLSSGPKPVEGLVFAIPPGEGAV